MNKKRKEVQIQDSSKKPKKEIRNFKKIGLYSDLNQKEDNSSLFKYPNLKKSKNYLPFYYDYSDLYGNFAKWFQIEKEIEIFLLTDNPVLNKN